MRHRALQQRLEDLQVQEEILVKQIDTAKETQEKSAVGELMLQYAALKARQDEVSLWMAAEESSPKYGTQVRTDGMWRPKLPEFGSIDKALEAMNSPTGGGIHSVAAMLSAREFRTVEDTREAVRALDGRSPLMPENERKPFNTTL